jgi:hypothetical protein
MPSSLCPGCGEHAINLITSTCEKCRDNFQGIDPTELALLRELHGAVGPLRDALTIMVAENFQDYPRACTCDRKLNDPHATDCPAGKNARRYLVHLVQPRQEREAQQRIEEQADQQAEAIRRALKDNPTALEEFEAAGLTKEWAESFFASQNPDERTICPECARPMEPDGDKHVVCGPCGLRLVKDVSDAVPPGGRDVEVWHCTACDQCFTFQRLDMLPQAVVLSGDEIPPTSCLACGGKLEQWACYRPFPAEAAMAIMGKRKPEEHQPIPKAPEQVARVNEIAERFNDLLELYHLGPFEPVDDDRNIYKLATEVAYEINGHRLILEVPDPWLETHMLEEYLGLTIVGNLEELGHVSGPETARVVDEPDRTNPELLDHYHQGRFGKKN